MPASRKRRLVEDVADAEQLHHGRQRRKFSPRASTILDAQESPLNEEKTPRDTLANNASSGEDSEISSDSSTVSSTSDSDSGSSTPPGSRTPSITADYSTRPTATSYARRKDNTSSSTSSSPTPISPSRPLPPFNSEAFLAAHTAAEENLFPRLHPASHTTSSEASYCYDGISEEPVPAPSLLSRLTSFLPRLAAANKILQEEEKQGKLKEREIDVLSVSDESEVEMKLPQLLQTGAGRDELENSLDEHDEGDESDPDSESSEKESHGLFIEMNLGLGVLEGRHSDSDTSSDTSSSSSLARTHLPDPRPAKSVDQENVEDNATAVSEKSTHTSSALDKLMDVHGNHENTALVASSMPSAKRVKSMKSSVALIEEIG